jgi:pimeloyl-ACP methyl ester carboxylesterase
MRSVGAAVVSRGGRPDLAGPWLSQVTAPTLLIVGSRDPAVLDLNRLAYRQLPGVRQLEVVSGATHLFEERGTLEAVAAFAAEWFRRFLGRSEEPSERSSPA